MPVEATGTTHVGTSTQSTEYLIKSMEEMKLQVTELQKVKQKFTTLEKKYDLSKINYAEERRKNKIMTEHIKALEKDLTFEEPLIDNRKIL